MYWLEKFVITSGDGLPAKTFYRSWVYHEYYKNVADASCLKELKLETRENESAVVCITPVN